MSTRTKIEWMALGIGTLFLAKYVVFGLRNWNACFHPGRMEDPQLVAFYKPFLGISG